MTQTALPWPSERLGVVFRLLLLASILAVLFAAFEARAQGRQGGASRSSQSNQAVLSLTGAQSASSRANPISSGQPFCIAADVIAQSSSWNSGTQQVIVQLGTFSAANSFAVYKTFSTVVASLWDSNGVQRDWIGAVISGPPITANGARLRNHSHRVAACWTPSGGLTGYIDGIAPAVRTTGVWPFTQPSTLYVGQYSGGGSPYGAGLANLCIAGPSGNVPNGTDTNDIANSCGQFDTGIHSAQPCYGCVTPDTTGTTDILVIGDSISNGSWGETRPWPSRLNALFGATYKVTNASQWGSQLTSMKTVYDASYHTPGLFDRCVLLGGVNDIAAGTSAATATTRATDLLDEMIDDGCDPIVILPTPANTSANIPPGAIEDAYNTYYDNLAAYCVAETITCVDTRATMGTGTGNKSLQAEFDFGDHLHPNQAGLDEIARLVWTAY